MSQKPDLDHREVERRFVESGRVLQIYGFLHLRPGSGLDEISEALNLIREDALDSLKDLWWGGWIVQDEAGGFYAVPIVLAPVVFFYRQLSPS
jgi:DNA-binding IclR family transcriptional regulator